MIIFNIHNNVERKETRMDQEVKLPPSTVTVKDGKVMRIQKWTLWNSKPFATITISRDEEGIFYSSIGDPEHGTEEKLGVLQHVIAALHPEVQSSYRQAFNAKNPTKEQLQKLFPKHQINFT